MILNTNGERKDLSYMQPTLSKTHVKVQIPTI